MIIILAIIATVIIGYLGSVFGHEMMNFPELGAISAIATMGGFILYAVKKNNKSNSD